MLRIYRNMKMHLEAFAQFSKKQITFNCLDLNFYEAFVNFLTRDYTLRRRTAEVKGLRINSIGMTVKELRAFLRNRIRKRIIAPIAMDGWKIIEERKSTRSTCRGRRSTGSKTLRLTGSRS